jgi:uncharacterized protein DUF4349
MKLTEKQIATELAAMRPAADPEFLASLDARVGTPGVLERLWAAVPRRIEPRLAIAACVLIAGVSATVVISSMHGARVDKASSGDGESALLAAPESTATDSAVKPSAGVAAGGPAVPSVVAPGTPRQVERNASLALSAEPGKVADVADGVVEVTDRYGGFVVSSNVNTGEGGSRARFQLRVPTAKLQDTLADLSQLAHVSSRNEGSLDITAPFVSASARAKDAQANVEGLLEQLANASSTTETDAIQSQLRTARQELAAAKAEVDDLSQRSHLSTIDVTVAGDGNDGGGWGIDDAAGDALSVLKAIAGATLIVLAVLLPLVLLGGLIWVGTSRARRRARDRALDS